MKGKGWSTNTIMFLILLGLAVFSTIGYLQGNQATTVWLIIVLPIVAVTWIIVRVIERRNLSRQSLQKPMTSSELKKLNTQTLILLIVGIAIVVGSIII